MEIEVNSRLKDSITEVPQKSKMGLIQETLRTISLDGQKPPIGLLRIQRQHSDCHLTMDNDVSKHRLMQASQRVLHLNLPPEKFTERADSATRTTLSRKTRTFASHSFIVIFLCAPEATKAKKQHTRQK